MSDVNKIALKNNDFYSFSKEYIKNLTSIFDSISKSSLNKLEKDLEIDSLGIVEVVMAFEDEFGIEIDDEELSDVETVSQAVNLLHSKI